MYTQCPDCSVVLSISATDLRVASGEVCCGACGSVFNALHHLIDTDQNPVSALIEEHAIAEQSSAETVSAAFEPESEEFELTEPITQNAVAPTDIDEENIAWSRTIAGLGLADQATLDALAKYDDDNQDPNTETEPESESETDSPEEPETTNEHKKSGVVFEFVEELKPDEADNPYDPDELLLNQDATSPWVSRGLWGLIVFAAVALMTQVLHFQRNQIATDPIWGPRIMSVYESLGVTLDPNWNVSNYNIAKGGGSQDPAMPGILLVSAQLSNIGDLSMPYPLVKLSLKDRWGDVVGGRTFTPPEYLNRTLAKNELLPGKTSVDLQIRLVDPGENADGFSLDACLNTPNGRLRCAYDTL